MDWLRDSLGWLGTAAFAAVAGYCVARLVAAARAPESYPGRHRAVDVAHVLMAVGMAAMLSPVGGPLPMAAWQTVFLLLTVWFAASWWHSRGAADTGWHGGWHGNGLHHALGAAAMLYMLTAMPHAGHSGAPWLPGGLGPDMTGMALPALGWVLAAYFLASAVVLVRWRSPAGPDGLPAVITGQAAMTACQTTMAAGTGVMLIVMLA
ncbi:DUF5134 domain-containing protein [Actinophytocola sp. KF-1]